MSQNVHDLEDYEPFRWKFDIFLAFSKCWHIFAQFNFLIRNYATL